MLPNWGWGCPCNTSHSCHHPQDTKPRPMQPSFVHLPCEPSPSNAWPVAFDQENKMTKENPTHYLQTMPHPLSGEPSPYYKTPQGQGGSNGLALIDLGSCSLENPMVEPLSFHERPMPSRHTMHDLNGTSQNITHLRECRISRPCNLHLATRSPILFWWLVKAWKLSHSSPSPISVLWKFRLPHNWRYPPPLWALN